MVKFKEFSKSMLNQNSIRSIYGGKDLETCGEDAAYVCKDTLKQDGTTVYKASDICGPAREECDAHCQEQ